MGQEIQNGKVNINWILPGYVANAHLNTRNKGTFDIITLFNVSMECIEQIRPETHSFDALN